MRTSAIYLEGSETFARPKPCDGAFDRFWFNDHSCQYCQKLEFDQCEDDNCEDQSPAPQWWMDDWKYIRFLGYWHKDCGERRFCPT